MDVEEAQKRLKKIRIEQKTIASKCDELNYELESLSVRYDELSNESQELITIVLNGYDNK